MEPPLLWSGASISIMPYRLIVRHAVDYRQDQDRHNDV